MAVSERSRDRGSRHARKIRQDFGRELREARLAAGLSQAGVARAAGLSQPRLSRLELAVEAPARVDELAMICAVLGLRLSLKAYPDGPAVRDAAQLRLISRFRPRIATGFRWRTEVPIGGAGDLRAWDVRLDGPGSVGIDAETRVSDVQALQRRSELKQRDSGVDVMILLIARSRHNAAVLRAHRAALESTFPAATYEVMSALRAGRMPVRNGIVVL